MLCETNQITSVDNSKYDYHATTVFMLELAKYKNPLARLFKENQNGNNFDSLSICKVLLTAKQMENFKHTKTTDLLASLVKDNTASQVWQSFKPTTKIALLSHYYYG